MAEQTPETLNHFATLSFTEDYWKLPQESRCEVREGFLSRLRQSVDAVHLYQLAALESRGDLLTWTASTAVPAWRPLREALLSGAVLHSTGTVGPDDRTIVVVLTQYPGGASFPNAVATVTGLVRALPVPAG